MLFMKHRASIKVHPRAYNKWFCDDYNYWYSQIKSGSKWVVLEKSTIDLVGKSLQSWFSKLSLDFSSVVDYWSDENFNS